MNIGKNLGSREAASKTARYPEMVAILERISIDWAMVVRGSNSRLNEVIPSASSASICDLLLYGSSAPISILPFHASRLRRQDR